MDAASGGLSGNEDCRAGVNLKNGSRAVREMLLTDAAREDFGE